MFANTDAVANWLRVRARAFVIAIVRLLLPAFARNTLSRILWLARYSSFIRNDASKRPRFEDRYLMYQHLLADHDLDGEVDYLEFGVAKGDSLRWWSEHLTHLDTRLVGFDTFEGLPERWGSQSAGTYTQNGCVPLFDDSRVQIEVGYFQTTLIPFLVDYKRNDRLIVHLDADLHSSTLFVLTVLAPYLQHGDIIIFDELGSISAADHEFAATQEFFNAYPYDYEVIATASGHKEVAVRMLADKF